MKNKDICDYDPRCIMSSALMFDDIIMDHIKRIESSHNHTEEHDCVFTNIVSDIIYIYNVHPLTNGFLNWKYIYTQEILSQRHFHYFKMIFYLLPKKLP